MVSTILLLRGLPSYHTISMKMCDKIVTQPFHFDHIPTQVPKYPHHSQNWESAKNTSTFWGVRLPQTSLSQKNPKNRCFLFKSVLKLELWNIQSQFSCKLLVFLGHDMKICFFLSLASHVKLHLWAGFHAKFVSKYEIFIQVTKCENMDSSPRPSILTIRN